MRPEFSLPSPFSDWLGRTVVGADLERGEIEVHYRPPAEARNRLGLIAGGALAGMLDSLTALVALCILPEGEIAVHRSLSVEYLRPATTDSFRGFGRALGRDGDTVRTTGELRDADDRVLARASAELRVRRSPKSDV